MDQRPAVPVAQLVDTIDASDKDQKDGDAEEDDEDLKAAADFGLFASARGSSVADGVFDG